jgi:transcriptional accessory protein Tex/SPT6
VKAFGIFLDINCHFDAFCHVSWLQDDFVEDPTTLFKEGDEVEARIVEIDRHKKRITVSMQSESFKEMELKSLESNQDYKDKKGQRMSSRHRVPKRSITSDHKDATVPLQKTENSSHHHDVATNKESNGVSVPTSRQEPATTEKTNQPLGNKTPAELKRERKLARRAERRALKEQETA